MPEYLVVWQETARHDYGRNVARVMAEIQLGGERSWCSGQNESLPDANLNTSRQTNRWDPPCRLLLSRRRARATQLTSLGTPIELTVRNGGGM